MHESFQFREGLPIENGSSVPAPGQRQTSAQLRKSNLTHLWIPFTASASTDGEIPLRRTNTTGIVKFNTALRVPFSLSSQKSNQ